MAEGAPCHEPLDFNMNSRRLDFWYGHALNAWLYALATGDMDAGEARQRECSDIVGRETAWSIHTRALCDARELHGFDEWFVPSDWAQP
jgi:hypothetical protein